MTREQLELEAEENRKAYLNATDAFDRRLYYEQMMRAQAKLRAFEVE